MAKPRPVYQVDWATSQQRARDLQSYLTDWVAKSTVKEMVCGYYSDCTASALKSNSSLPEARRHSFHEAQGHSVGRYYDLSTVDHVPLRVLIVPMEAGGGGSYFSVAERTAAVPPSRRLPWETRNPHMKGVTLALWLALGLPYKDRHGLPLIDPQTELVSFTDGPPAHLFDCYAMANLLLCSAVEGEDGQAGRGTAVMRKNCAPHLQAAIEILQPTLVISQGWGLVPTLRKNFGVTRTFGHNIPDCILADCNLNDNPFVWVGLWHPTRFWSTINQPYFRETARPAIKKARMRALKLAQTV
jgi:hypothetical protein